MSWIIEVEPKRDPETNERYWAFVLKREVSPRIDMTDVYEVARSVSRSKTREDAIRLAKIERDRHIRKMIK